MTFLHEMRDNRLGGCIELTSHVANLLRTSFYGWRHCSPDGVIPSLGAVRGPATCD